MRLIGLEVVLTLSLALAPRIAEPQATGLAVLGDLSDHRPGRVHASGRDG